MKGKERGDTLHRMVYNLDLCIYYGFHVLVIILPLIISYRITNDQFDLVKLTFLRVITIFLFLCLAMKFLLENRVQIRRSSLDYPILIFLALILISCIFSVHPITSLFGKYQRYEGLLTFINYGMLFFLASQFFENLDQIRSIAQSMVIAAGIVSIYGLLQRYGLEVLSWEALFVQSGRSFSTFGNPVFLGGYLVIVLPISLGLIFSASGLRQRIIFGALAMLILSCLIMTFSRGAWLGGFFGLFGFFALGWKGPRGKKKAILLTFSFFVITILLLILPSFLLVGSNIGIRERLDWHILSQRSSRSRLEIWKSSIKMIKARPFFGFGPDCYRLAFRKYETRTLKQLAKLSATDNAHNYFLQIASTAGIPATFGFVTIMGVFAFAVQRLLVRLKGNNEYFLVSGFALSVFGYLLHLFFGISVVGTTSFLWLTLGMITGVSSDVVARELEWRDDKGLGKILLGSGALLISFLLVSLSLFPLIGDFHFARANRSEEMGNYESSVIEYEEASRYAPYLDNYYCRLGSLNMKWVGATKEKKYFDRAVVALETAKRASPLETKNRLQLALTYLFGAKQFDSDYHASAIYELRETLVLEPHSSYAYYLLGIDDLDSGRSKEAVGNLKKAIDIVPSFEEAHCYLGVAYEQLGQDKKAIGSYRKALSLNPENREAKEALERIRSQGEF